MRAINHALTGAIIGLTVDQPTIALPASLLSHYVLDAIPHHGGPNNDWLRTKLFRNLLYGDAILCTVLVIVLVLARPRHWLVAIVCAFLAAVPDAFSLNRYRKTVGHMPWQGNWYSRFAHNIQWFERPIGAVVEVAWFIAGVIVVAVFLT